MTPIQMIDAGVRALRAAETGTQTALAWAALAGASMRWQDWSNEIEGER